MILDEIIEYKKEELEETRRRCNINEMRRRVRDLPPPRDFHSIFSSKSEPAGKKTRIIAEVKKASPSNGLLCPGFEPIRIGMAYVENGASALSVLTEKRFFQGNITFLTELKKRFHLPVLRKDFIIEEYQIYESLAAGADAILLIVRILEKKQLKEFISLTHELNMTPLVEVHTKDELEIALSCNARFIGINNRDLDTFKVDLNTTVSLLPFVPEDRLVISESGISSREDILLLEAKGVKGFLVGEALIRERDMGTKLRGLLGID
ncbi:MAG: indole-3-glycerol phosphate synthase TrpC [Thermodesulfobacteriota bacterium]